MEKLTAKKRTSLRDSLLKTKDDPMYNEELFARIDADMEAARDTRYAALSTMSRQDRVLSTYTIYVEGRTRTRLDTFKKQKHKDKFLFPKDQNALFQNLQGYLHYIALKGIGRRRSDHMIHYDQLCQYRTDLCFWVLKVRSRREWPHIPERKLIAKMSDTLRYCLKTYELELSPERHAPEVGVSELRTLIDVDMTNTRYIEVAEMHHLAWCMGRVTAVRPGSIGQSRPGSGGYLTWGEVSIVRLEEQGKFQVEISFKSLKTNNNSGDPELARKKKQSARILICNVLAPSEQEHLIFSIPHRLLVIALRHNLLLDYDNLEELLSGDLRHIRIRPEYLDKPIFLGAKEKGEGLLDRPMSAAALTGYLRRRGRWAGFTEDITFYAFRRRSATDLARVVGNDAARAIMNHDPETRTLEHYYLNVVPNTNLTAITLNEAGVAIPAAVGVSRSLALNALKQKKVAEILGPSLNALLKKLEQTDPNYPKGACGKVLTNYKRRLRDVAIQFLFSEESEKQRVQMKVTDYSERYATLNKCGIVDRIFEGARKERDRRHAEAVSQNNYDDEDGDLLEEELGVVHSGTGAFILPKTAKTDSTHEDDIENLIMQVKGTLIRDTDELCRQDQDTGGQDTLPSQIRYIDAVRSFMSILLDNPLSPKHIFKSKPVPCEECQKDETLGAGYKNRRYVTRVKLERHLASLLHTPRSKWRRSAAARAKNNGGKIICPYCEAIGKPKALSNIDNLMRHLETTSCGEAHDDLMRNDGVNCEGWNTPPGLDQSVIQSSHHTNSRYYEQRKGRALTSLGIQYSDAAGDLENLQPVEHPDDPRLTLGASNDPAIPRHVKAVVLAGNDPVYDSMPARIVSPSKNRTHIPARFRGFVDVEES